ncbi:amphi-Trp domain-containing protein [Natrialbaceae archaeon A-gly3]
MADDVTFPESTTDGKKTITDGFFEREIYLSRGETAAFLRDLADAIEGDSRLVLTGSDWEIPFEYREPLEIEIEFAKQHEGELEIEVELTEASGSGDLTVR